MSKGNNLQSLFCGILFCISVTALIIACLAFTKKGGGKGEYYEGGTCGLQPKVPLCWSSSGLQGFIIEGKCSYVPPSAIEGILTLCKDDCSDWKDPAAPNPPWAKCISMDDFGASRT
jgi:hypothetical protein